MSQPTGQMLLIILKYILFATVVLLLAIAARVICLLIMKNSSSKHAAISLEKKKTAAEDTFSEMSQECIYDDVNCYLTEPEPEPQPEPESLYEEIGPSRGSAAIGSPVLEKLRQPENNLQGREPVQGCHGRETVQGWSVGDGFAKPVGPKLQPCQASVVGCNDPTGEYLELLPQHPDIVEYDDVNCYLKEQEPEAEYEEINLSQEPAIFVLRPECNRPSKGNR